MANKIKEYNKYNPNFKYNLREYWSLLTNYKYSFFGLLILVIIVESLFIIDKFLFKAAIDKGTKYINGNLPKDVFLNFLGIITIVFLSIVIIRVIGKWIQVHLLIKLDTTLSVNLKRKYFNHIISLSHDFHTTHKTGSLISRLNRGRSAIETMTDLAVMNIAPLIIQLIVVGISVAVFDLTSSLVLLATTITFIGYSFYLQEVQKKYKTIYNTLEDREKGFISDIFTNVDSIKYYGKENYIQKLYLRTSEKTLKADKRYGGFYRWFDSGQILILNIGLFFMLYFPFVSFLNGGISLGTLVFIYTVYGNVVGPMFGFVWGMKGFYRALSDFEELFQYGKIENEIKDNPNAKNLSIEKGAIDFENISFSYGKRKIFSNFNLNIKPNEKIALVGHSGSGKTTIVKLLYRFYDVQKGRILINSKAIKDVKQESLRSELSIVPQEGVLFDDTIYNNIAFSKPNASREEVLRAMKFAQLDTIIKNFPQKENTIVGERGVRLSGGEKQRVSIARAILADKKVLILDEATSSLDSETEHEIQKDLQKLLQGRTAIIIAHRLSTIMNADRIIVLKEGKIVQEGKHSELIRQQGEYRKLWNLQKGGYIGD
ncbi:MAG: ABC transporter ATP-binding protein [Nanoarchaeota archaeon]